MKKIVAFLKPFKLDGVLEKLQALGVEDVLVSEVRGYGRQKGQLELYQAGEYELTFLPKACVEIYCPDERVGEVQEILIAGARTGRIGDGKLLVLRVEQVEEF